MSFLKKLIRKNLYIYEYLRGIQSRAICYRLGLANVKFTSKIVKPLYISHDFVFGDYGFINANSYIGAKVVCGNYVMFGPNVTIAGSDHRYDIINLPMYFSGRPELKQTKIGHDVWIGAGSIIKAGVSIGNGSIVAMGSIVLNDIPSYTIYGGSPAIFIKNRFNSNVDIETHEAILKQSPSRLSLYCTNQD